MRDITDAPEGLVQALDCWDGKTTRREFLQRSGLFVFGARMADVAPSYGTPVPRIKQQQGRTRTSTSATSTLGSSFARTARRPSTLGKRTEDREPEPPSVR